MGNNRKKTSFVPRLVWGAGVGISVVPLCVATAACGDRPGPVIYPASVDAGQDADAQFDPGSVGDAAETPDAADDGPLGPIIYPAHP